MSKQILFNQEALEKLKIGVNKLAKAVRSTLGPKGKVVGFRRGSEVIFADDGVTIANQIELKDNIESFSCDAVKEVANQTEKKAGNGTTTAILLSQSIFNEGLKAIIAGIDPIALRKGLHEALNISIDIIKKISKPTNLIKDIHNVGTIASRDPEVGKIIAEIIKKVGKEAIIAVEESSILGLDYEIVKGLEFEQGYISPYMMTHQDRGEAILDKPYILTTSQVISTNQDVVGILEEVLRSESKSLLIVSDNVSGEALPTIIINKLQGRMKIVAVKAPGFGDDKMDRLEDLSILTGSKFISEQTGSKVEDAKLEDLGRADRVIITKDKTIIIGGKGKKVDISKRVAQIDNLIKVEKSEYKKESFKKRLGKLKGGVAVIKVGTISEQENKEKRFGVEDAVRSTMSAIEEGIVPGGGIALLEASKTVRERADKEKDINFRTGLIILANAMESIPSQIIDNSGGKADEVIYKINEGRKNSKSFGYNADNETYGDMFKMGVIDPTKVVRVGLENAVSIISSFLITECVIVDEPEEKKD